MSIERLLWIGYSSQTRKTYGTALEAELNGLTVGYASTGERALGMLTQNPGDHLLVVIDQKLAKMDMGNLITGIKQTNPAIEIIVLGNRDLSWSKLTLPRNYRPVLLGGEPHEDVLISCVAKLQEIVEAKDDYAVLSRKIRGNVAMAQKGTDALLGVLHRQDLVGTIGMRRDGFFASCNAEAERLTGYTVDEAAHIQVWAQTLIVDYEGVRSLLRLIERCWGDQTGGENIQLRIRRKDGRTLTLAMTLMVLPDGAGQARHMVALFYDAQAGSRSVEYELLMQHGACGLYSYHPQLGFTGMSCAALDVINRAFRLALSMEDLLGRTITDLPLPMEMAQKWNRFLNEVGSDDITDDMGPEPLGLPGRRIAEHGFAVKIGGSHKGDYSILAELAERQELQAAGFRDASTKDLAAMTLEALPRPFIILRAVRDSEGEIIEFRCVVINPAAAKLLHLLERTESDPTLSAILKDEEAYAIIESYAKKAAETGRDSQLEIWIRPDGSQGEPILVSFWMGKVGDGAAVFFIDVTAKRREERQLKQYGHMFSHMQEAIIVTDLQGDIVDWNPASERMFGYSKPEIIGRSAEILTQKITGDQLDQESRQVLRDGDVWRGEYEFVRGDGTTGVAASVFAHLKDDHGNPYGTVGICHDLTERKRFEEMLTVKGQELQEKNLALNTLLRHAEAERVRACKEIALELTRRLTDGIHKIIEAKRSPKLVESLAELLLQDLGGKPAATAPDEDDPRLKLSEKELEVAQLIRLGKSTKEIAFILDKSPDTIRLQRISIRKKLGLTRRDRSLPSYLKQLDLT
ncbi:PAS domain S-box protein [Thermodesulfobacteriota bacterium]